MLLLLFCRILNITVVEALNHIHYFLHFLIFDSCACFIHCYTTPVATSSTTFHPLIVIEIGEAQSDKEVSEGDQDLIIRRHVVNKNRRVIVVRFVNQFGNSIAQGGGNVQKAHKAEE